jgi:polar amino acid transport system substrate-binding protein
MKITPLTKYGAIFLIAFSVVSGLWLSTGSPSWAFNWAFNMTSAKTELSPNPLLNPLKVAILEDSPPYDFYNDQNQLVGMNLDLMNEVGRRMGRPVQFQVTTYNRVILSLLNGQVDVIAAPQSVSAYRSKVVMFTRPYLFSTDLLVSHQESLNTLEDLMASQKLVGVFNGTSYPQFLKARHLDQQMAIYPTQREMFLAFLNQKIPVMMMDEHIARYYQKSQALPFHLSNQPVRAQKAMAFAVRKSDSELGNTLNRVLIQMEQDGALAQIRSQWL